ncbi:acyl--CoA ligase [Verticiella sediminum]|uniref:Acyl--CoA ligase n=1 Tax=Verticiella sediminum TaxID=1247510 RepID=A0A556AZX6_9BURK|nr:class I adenylate-forming enzyme family protein [Verticiella sediminum]TSH98035.1 acyl--CoA ligase [Verticiella sediminum]
MSTTTVTDTTPVDSVALRIARTAAQRPQHRALLHNDDVLTYAELDALMDRIAAALQRDGIEPTGRIAICATNSNPYAAVYLGALRAGVAVAPLPPSAAPAALAAMLADSGARHLFVDSGTAASFAELPAGVRRIALDDAAAGAEPLSGWLAPEGAKPAPVQPLAGWPFNVIYSSGTTGTPKGIVQPFGMRAAQLQGGSSTLTAYGPDSVTLLSTPLYSNTTLVSFFSTMGNGGTTVFMGKFDVAQYLALAERHRMTHTMLVPAQYQRLMAYPDFDKFDLSSTQVKQCTSAPFRAELKAEVLRRWPGRLIESYGMTEGGGVCILECDRYPDKLHTVGKPAPKHQILLLDDEGRPARPGEQGEIVGRSGAMMTGYLNLPEKTAEAVWFDEHGNRYIRTGDVGRFDADGFLQLVDRKKDMIISGGFNIYPSDIEAEVRKHPDVADVSVVGVVSERWGETPVAFVVLRDGAACDAATLLGWANERLGKMQRLADVRLIDELPRSAIGKVLKRELRDAYDGQIA